MGVVVRKTNSARFASDVDLSLDALLKRADETTLLTHPLHRRPMLHSKHEICRIPRMVLIIHRHVGPPNASDLGWHRHTGVAGEPGEYVRLCSQLLNVSQQAWYIPRPRVEIEDRVRTTADNPLPALDVLHCVEITRRVNPDNLSPRPVDVLNHPAHPAVQESGFVTLLIGLANRRAFISASIGITGLDAILGSTWAGFLRR